MVRGEITIAEDIDEHLEELDEEVLEIVKNVDEIEKSNL